MIYNASKSDHYIRKEATHCVRNTFSGGYKNVEMDRGGGSE